MSVYLHFLGLLIMLHCLQRHPGNLDNAWPMSASNQQETVWNEIKNVKKENWFWLRRNVCIICSPTKEDVENRKEITAVVLGPDSIAGAIII